ncbi:SDR family NAD(P)-dependent oxidoreductase [Devosia sp.]|uniref:SDR family NAD(P)-dependent oxidoreductase n=1 Tax=Devosia sp. TaxID=1871048 RepID=UPI003A91C870
MLIDLKSKTAIVTGAGRGIGREIARTLAREGVRVAIFDASQDLLDDAATEWEAAGWDGMQLALDIRDKAAIREAVDAVEQQFERIDILVNNAGVAGGAKVETLDEAMWDVNFDVNMKGMFLVCQAVVPVMKRQRSGRILNASSYAAITPSVGGAAYAASKSAVVGFTRVLAGELGPWDVTVNAYAPGMIPTQMNRFADQPEARKEKLLDTLTLRRWGEAKDVANLICFLSSDLAGYITGTLIDVSGGKYATQMPWLAYEQN